MPLVQSAASAMFGVSKQALETTVLGTATYVMPVFSGLPQPEQSMGRIAVTGAAAFQGDPYKTDEHWGADVVIPAFEDALGVFLVGLWPTDGTAGTAAPYTHTFTGLGNATPWLSFFSDKPGTLKERFEAGQITSLGVSFENGGGPVKVNVGAYGKKPTVYSYVAGTTKTTANGYLIAAGSTLKLDVDSATPVTVDSVVSATIVARRGIVSDPTADSIYPAYLSQGLYSVEFALDLVYSDYDAYRATFYGAAAGSNPSATIVEGSLEFTLPHSKTAGYELKLTVPRGFFAAEAPQPDAGGGPYHISIAGEGLKPGSGDALQPVLKNGISATY